MYTAHQTSTKLIISDTGPAGGESINLSPVFLHSSPLSLPPSRFLSFTQNTVRINLFSSHKMLVLCLYKSDLS